MLAGDAQEMLNVHGRLPGRRILMVGSDNAGLLIAANLRDAGAVIVAVIDESPRIAGREFNAAPLRAAGVELLTGAKVIRACGKGYLERVIVGALDDAGVLVEGAERTFDVDMICVAGDRTSEHALALAVGVPVDEHAIMGGPVPVRSREMSTPMPNLFVCGDGAGVENGAVALETGLIAGLNASISTGWTHPEADRLKRRARARIGYLRRGRRGAARREAEHALANVYRRLARTPGAR
jgi:sarcosine oxidase subunit alpha